MNIVLDDEDRAWLAASDEIMGVLEMLRADENVDNRLLADCMAGRARRALDDYCLELSPRTRPAPSEHTGDNILAFPKGGAS